MPRFGRRGKGATTDDTPTAARDEHTSEVEQAVQQRRADDAPDPATTESDAADTTEVAGAQDIDARFRGQDFGMEDQLADMIGQTGGDEDPLASFAGVDTAFGATGRERLNDLVADLAPDDGEQDGPRYGKDMIAGDKDQSVVSGHPGAYGVVWKDGEVTDHYAASPVDDDGMFLGIDVGAMAYEKEMNRKAEEVAQQRGSGSGSGSGSGTPPPTTNPNGPNTTTDDAGTNTTTDPVTGDTYVTNPDGSQAVVHPDGSMDLYDKDGNHVEHQDPPPADPPPEDPPPEDPPPEDPPADPPPEDGDDAPSTEMSGDPDEESAPLPEELTRQLETDVARMRAAKNAGGGGDGATDPSEIESEVVGAAGELPSHAEMGQSLFGQPGTESETAGGPSDAGYYNHSNTGAIDPGEDEVITGGPQRNDDPFDATGPALEPVEQSEDSADVAEFLPPSSEIAGPVDDPGADVPDQILETP